MEQFSQILLLLGVAVAIVIGFQWLRIPSSLGYLLVGVILGPHTIGPVVDLPQLEALAEFGVVFLLFTIGLNFSLPQLHALRHQVLWLGTAQVAFTTMVVALLAWWIGTPAAAAFVIGAVFAQSSTTIIGKQLTEQSEDSSRHGRLGLAMSVFQDVTAVPFVVVIPVLGLAASVSAVSGALALALAKAVAAFALVFLAGRWLLRPLFHFVAQRRSTELFTLTVLLVALLAAWTTAQLGLSLAFGAFLAGMMLGETEFRHQVEATIRPFRDVLLGLFFIGIGMLFDPAALPSVWQGALLGALILLISKAVLVTAIVRLAGIDPLTACRTGLLLAVGGEFGFALLALGLSTTLIEPALGQTVLTAVLFSMILGPILIRYNHAIASRVFAHPPTALAQPGDLSTPPAELKASLSDHVLICGYGRIGQGVAHFLRQEQVPFVALDLDVDRVREAHLAGEPVFYGDAAEPDMLDAVGVERARLLVISHDDVSTALIQLQYLKSHWPKLPVMVRTRDETHVKALQAAGALEVVPETLEASLMIAAQTLLLLDVPAHRVMTRIQEQRGQQYRLVREFFPGNVLTAQAEEQALYCLRSVALPAYSPVLGQSVTSLMLAEARLTALVRDGERLAEPAPSLRLRAGDVLVLYGPAEALDRLEQQLTAET